MPSDIRFLAPHSPRSTGIDQVKPANNSNAGATVGTHVTAAPGAGQHGQRQVVQARQILAATPGAERVKPASPSQRAQYANVQLNERPRQNIGTIRAGTVTNNSGFQGSDRKVEILQRSSGGPAIVVQSPFEQNEILLIGGLVQSVIEHAQNNPEANSIAVQQLPVAQRVIEKLTRMMESQPAPSAGVAPQVQVNPQPVNITAVDPIASIPGVTVIGAAPSVVTLPKV